MRSRDRGSDMKRGPAVSVLSIVVSAGALLASQVGVAQDFRPKNSISTEAAEGIADACLAWHRDHSDQLPPAIWVLDVDGVSVIVKRADHATRAAVEAAHVKAQVALYSARPSRVAQDSAGNGEESPRLAGIVEGYAGQHVPGARRVTHHRGWPGHWCGRRCGDDSGSGSQRISRRIVCASGNRCDPRPLRDFEGLMTMTYNDLAAPT